MQDRTLDVICLGRSSVDLYGEQVGGRLEDMQSFAKYVGGCATNISVGCSRLGLKSALITRVGDEQMGSFIRQTLIDEGVDISHVTTDPERLSALVILGIRDLQTSPHIFYRENCADMALSGEHIDPAYIASAKALVLTGTHFSQPGVEEASRKAQAAAKKAGTKVVLDIDYRPVAWGLTSHGDGESRFVESADVTAHVQTILADCDLIVGTEEEIHIAGGSTNTLQAVKNIRALSQAAIVVKRGPMGCVVFPDVIPDDLEKGITVTGRKIEVFNTLGAGDGFMSGFLRGWVAGEDWETCCRFGNACGAIVVSRHGCAPAIPSWQELQIFLEEGSSEIRLRHDKKLSHIHRTTNRKKQWREVCAIAFDHRGQFEEIAEKNSASPEDISQFKRLIAEGARNASDNSAGFGVIIDDKYGFDSLAQASDGTLWVARPVELPGSRPLQFEGGPNIAATLHDWPESHVAKCLVSYHPNDDQALKDAQIQTVSNLYEACLTTGHDMLLEVILPQNGMDPEQALLTAMGEFYDAGIMPDWWKLSPPRATETWEKISALIEARDPWCRGVLMLGLNAPMDELRAGFELAAAYPVCKGFAVGRSLFYSAAEDWFAKDITDAEATARIARNYRELLQTWRDARTSSAAQE